MKETKEKLVDVLNRYVGIIMARSIFEVALNRTGFDLDKLQNGEQDKLVTELHKGLSIYVTESQLQNECFQLLKKALLSDQVIDTARRQKVFIEITDENDILIARSQGRLLCQELKFPLLIQTKVATAISELARNIVQYAGAGHIEINALNTTPPGVEIIACDQGPGIPHLNEILERKYVSPSGMGMGLYGTRNLMDEFEVDTKPGEGTTIRARKFIG